MKYLAISPEVAYLSLEGKNAVSTDGVVNVSGIINDYTELIDHYRVAFESSAKEILVCIDSPGGNVAGLFDAMIEIDRMRKQYGKRVVVHAVEANSAAYGIACCSDEIVVSPGGIVGSVGVIGATVDCTSADAMMGIKYHVFSSGARKADGNPHVPMTDDSMLAAQARVDELSMIFCGMVKERRGVDAAPLEARTYVGQSAVAVGLADRVGTISDARKGKQMALSDAMAALKAVTEDDLASESDKKKAKKMMAAHEEPDGDEGEKPDGDGDEKALAAVAVRQNAEIQSMKATLSAMAESSERAALMAQHPGLPAELVAHLNSKPMAYIRERLAEPSAGSRNISAAMAAAGAPLGSLPDAKVPGAPRIEPELDAKIKAACGMAVSTKQVEVIGNQQFFRAGKVNK